EILAGQKPAPSKNVDTLAMEVIAGKWGNGAERQRRLTAAGHDYNAVQARVNAILSGGGPASPAPQRQYTVRPGDTLSSIAANFGIHAGWQAIYNKNRAVIGKNPNL